MGDPTDAGAGNAPASVRGRPLQLEFEALILRQVSDAVISIDHGGVVTYLNPAAERQYRANAADAIGRPLQELYTYRYLTVDDERQAARALAREGFWRGHNLHVLRDGTELHVDSSVSVLTDASGARVGLLAVIRDITERRAAAEALERAEERQRMALDAADLGTWQHDITAGRIELDARARVHYGIDAESIAMDELLSRIHPDDRPGLERDIAAAIDPVARAPVAAEYRVLGPDGRVRWLSINGQVHFDQAGGSARAAMAVGTSRDISAQKRVEEALREADRRKDEFLAILAHELRNPLAPIRAAVGLLRSADIPERLRARSRDIIERQVVHMARLVDDLLDVSRLSRGQMSLQRRPVRLEDVLDAAVETARPLIEEHRHQLEQHRCDTGVWVDGDLARLSQVFANLLNNAAKYTAPGGVIGITVTERDHDVAVSVRDSGQGIAAQHLDRIFSLFAQGGGGSAPIVGGLGIGLALSRRLVEMHGGTLTAASDGIGHGATFTVTLPVIRHEAAASDEFRGTARAAVKRRVLVVDDSTDAADTTASLLEASGCEVRAEYSGERAIRAVHEFRPEVVLLDLGMPGLDGIETCRRIRALPNSGPLFIVAVTGWGQEENRRQTEAAGFDAHLVKPVAPDVLLDLVRQAATGSR